MAASACVWLSWANRIRVVFSSRSYTPHRVFAYYYYNCKGNEKARLFLWNIGFVLV